jgi:hypothetical protein
MIFIRISVTSIKIGVIMIAKLSNGNCHPISALIRRISMNFTRSAVITSTVTTTFVMIIVTVTTTTVMITVIVNTTIIMITMTVTTHIVMIT